MSLNETETWPSKIRVLFVSDKPPKNGLNTFFLGDRHARVLQAWLKQMDVAVDEFVGINTTDAYFLESAKSFAGTSIPIIALGTTSHELLKKAKILHYSLPHPSTLNYTKTKDQIEVVLKRAKIYIDNIEAFYK